MLLFFFKPLLYLLLQVFIFLLLCFQTFLPFPAMVDRSDAEARYFAGRWWSSIVTGDDLRAYRRSYHILPETVLEIPGSRDTTVDADGLAT